MIRLTGGEWNGRKVKTPKGAATRPTSSRIREALFNVLGQDVLDRDFYDLFAGSGVVGFEALSRGARHCTFVEVARGAVQVLRANVMLLGCRDRATYIAVALPNWLRSPAFAPKPPVILFLDPPYDTELAEKTLHTLADLSVPWDGSICTVQAARGRQLAPAYGPWRLGKTYPHGDSVLWVYRAGNAAE
jgi:16S rRNA (guanine(966)-N(2))-methyltransferase RsmD